jgi:AraC-like DNA-binding protein
VEAGPGTFISVNPGEVHDGHALGRRARSWRILYFDPSVLGSLFADLQGRDTCFEFAQPVFRDDGLLAAFESAFASASGADDDVLACESRVLELLANLRPHATSIATAAARATPDVRRARDRMEADPAEQHSLESLARECALGRFQFLRAFRKTFGLPPHAYLLQRRLARARRLLHARTPLAEVAAAAGFSDQSHLTRCFTRQFGLPPGRYSAAIR